MSQQQRGVHLHRLAERVVRRVPHVALQTLALERALGVGAGVAAGARDLALVYVCGKWGERVRWRGRARENAADEHVITDKH